jgi:superfamily II DNA or RNA helicase
VNAAAAIERLERAAPLYFLPRDDLLSVLVPAIGASSQLDCMMGFFSSSSFAEIAPGLATFLRQSQSPMRLIISPYVTAADQRAIAEGLSSPGEAASKILGQDWPDADALTIHTLTCLAHLIARNRLEIRIAFMKEGLFHPKAWLLNVGGHRVAFHGSSNLTGAGLAKNKENIAIARAWIDETQAQTERRVRDEFRDIWEDEDDSCATVSLPKAVTEKLLRDYGSRPEPDESDARKLWRQARGLKQPEEGEVPVAAPRRAFEIPSWLEYQTGAYQHQGHAVDAWLAAQGRGVLAMATGSGKTLTSLVACHRLHAEATPMLIVVAAPYVPLIMQWCDEIALFGLEPRNLSEAGGPVERRRLINEAGRNLAMGLSRTEALVVSHDTLTDPDFKSLVAKIDARKVLIADEMHNLGSPSFLSATPDFFDYRLGLSATPRRQYDPQGTDQLFAFFGPVCFEFSLDEAINVCLVPYDYYVHRVQLNVDEMESFKDLSEKISRHSWKIASGVEDAYLDSLLRERRLIIEKAEGKIGELASLIDAIEPRRLRYELIYATDKAPEQLRQVNALLMQRGVLFHQLTAEETADRVRTRSILTSFERGELQVLTAKRVLDEGVNVPQIKRAFILASTTVERQWVQRRGRILRKCDAIGKTHGVIHDFVALPPPDMVRDADARKLVEGELRRVQEFARLARNYGAADGPIAVLEELQGIAYPI